MKPTGDISFFYICLGHIESSLKQTSSDMERGSARDDVTVACRLIRSAKDLLLDAIEEESDL